MNTNQITAATAFVPENRMKYLGGTDISALCGFNQYKTPFECWLEKTGQSIKEEDEENELFIWGHLLEPVIALEWLRRNPEWEIVSENDFAVDCEFDFLCANTDREIKHKVTGEIAILECKTVASSAFRHWKLGVPLTYYTQGEHYLGVKGYDRVIFAMLVMDSRQLETFEVVRDEAYIAEIRNMAVEFWQTCVLGGVRPDLTAHDWSVQIAEDKFVTADEVVMTAWEKIKALNKQIKELEEARDTHKETVQVQMQDAELMRSSDGALMFTWKGSKTDKVDSKKLKAEFPEVAALVSKEAYTRRFLIK